MGDELVPDKQASVDFSAANQWSQDILDWKLEEQIDWYIKWYTHFVHNELVHVIWCHPAYWVATTYLLCAIDHSGYMLTGGRRGFTQFIKTKFPPNYKKHRPYLYKAYRNFMAHGLNPEPGYVLLAEDGSEKRHLEETNTGGIYLHIRVFHRDYVKGANSTFKELKGNKGTQETFKKAWEGWIQGKKPEGQDQRASPFRLSQSLHLYLLACNSGRR